MQTTIQTTWYVQRDGLDDEPVIFHGWASAMAYARSQAMSRNVEVRVYESGRLLATFWPTA